MTSLRATLLVVLLTTVLAVGLSVANDEAPAMPAAAEAAAAQPAAEPADVTTCSGTTDQAQFLASQWQGHEPAEPSSLHCNCNSNQDCDRLCGEESGTCFIGPVCDNWPDYTGKCMCSKTVDAEPR